MKKIFKMARAELSKIFMRPSMFVLTTILVLALIFSFMFFAPSEGNRKIIYDSTNVSSIHNQFIDEYEISLEEIKTAKKNVEEYMTMTQSSSIHDEFIQVFYSLKDYYKNTFEIEILQISQGSDSILSEDDKAICNRIFPKLEEKSRAVLTFMRGSIKDNQIDFILKESKYNEIYNTIKKFNGYLVNFDVANASAPSVRERASILKENFDLTEMYIEICAFKKIEIDPNELQVLLDTYYNANLEVTPTDTILKNRLNELYQAVEDYYKENEYAGIDEKIAKELNEKIAQYRDYIHICSSLIESEFELMRIGQLTDDEISTLMGFEGESKYNLQKSVTTNKYFFEHNTFGYEYLSPFNFGVKSGSETNAYDFAFYAMQILSCFIIIFVIFFATSTLAGEQTSGTLKMTATRPFTRNKLYSGKLLACFNVALILLLISLVCSFAVGVAVYGFTSQNVLLVINANQVVVMHPLVVMGIYLVSLLIDVLFYIILAVLISIILKPTTISTALSCAVYIVSVIFLGTTTASWIRLIPSLNLGLYKFFTNSQVGFFSFSVVPNTSLLSCGLVTLISIIGLDILARFIFTRKSLDK